MRGDCAKGTLCRRSSSCWPWKFSTPSSVERRNVACSRRCTCRPSGSGFPYTRMTSSCSSVRMKRMCAWPGPLWSSSPTCRGCEFAPIRCTDDHVAQVHLWFPCQVINLPFRHLEGPLSTHRLKKDDLMPLVDAVADIYLSGMELIQAGMGRMEYKQQAESKERPDHA
jgi:hypothetical protein